MVLLGMGYNKIQESKWDIIANFWGNPNITSSLLKYLTPLPCPCNEMSSFDVPLKSDDVIP